MERAGLTLIAAEKSRTREAVGKFIGIKQKRVILIGDELSELSEAILQSGLSNLSKNPYFQMIGMSNPASRFDAFGVWAEPREGWDMVDVMRDDEWETKWGGKYIRLDGERSPNILAGETIYPFIQTQEMIDETKALLGETSRGYMRMVRAIFFDSDETEGIYSEAELVRLGAFSKAEFVRPPTKVAGLDPSFTNGGDRTALVTAFVGLTKTGQYAFQVDKTYYIEEDSRLKSVPRTYQIVQKVADILDKEGVEPYHLAVDSTAAGNPFCDVLEGEWKTGVIRVQFGGVPSDKRVSRHSRMRAKDLYTNRATELWFFGKELLRSHQLYGIPNSAVSELVSRNFTTTKSSGALKSTLEPKSMSKSRLGKSPDLADAIFLAMSVGRERLGLMSEEPRKDELTPSGYPRPTKNFKRIKDALVNDESRLSA